MTTFWPGTKVPKSTGNAFDLSTRPQSIFYTTQKSPPKPKKTGPVANQPFSKRWPT